ncbi:curved DNA-binding protein [Reichenbachiella agariperforans]|uniref:Curved DNA-binding protein n=1 Tax=Reichenbachiella agariperforans TaxID=156994 RepID=A0A1M6JRF9_REIAG|nr:J domain-containing protein [Reichenbachiella agariperforans]SHJ49335.1 curved DNA-binding protein [Reichenbachiella agariperforans]
MFIDYYKTLGIDQKATQDDIKKAYRKLARKFHPDLNPNNADAKLNFQQINEANSVLSDLDKRKKYDQYGKDWEHADEFEKAKRTQSANQRQNSTSQNRGDYSDFFESMFGGAASGQGRQVKYRGEDFQTTLQLSLIDAYKTHQQNLTVNRKTIRITIPAGIENGQTIKIKNHGGAGINGGPNGDLYISFSIASHPDFKRLGNDLYTTKTLDLYTAILGGELMIDTLDGRVKLKVKPETQNGEKVKLKGKGFPVYKKEAAYGDLFLSYDIKIPTGLTDKQKELFTELSKA